VSWTASAASGSAITGYIVTPYVATTALASRTFGTALSQVFTGLANGTTYTFKVAAKNAIGTGPQSAATISITVGAPTAPGGASASVGGSAGTVALHWTAPANNGSAITGYIVTPYVGGSVGQTPIVFNSSATSEQIAGLASHVSYTFRVAAKNARGTGPASAASNAVTTT
jgi:hypothetical protein